MPADETGAVRGALTEQAAVEETVHDGEHAAGILHRHESAVGGVAVDGAADVDRRAAVLYDGVAAAIGHDAADELLAARDGAGGA